MSSLKNRSVEEIEDFLKNLKITETVNESELKILLKELHLKQTESALEPSTLGQVLLAHFQNLNSGPVTENELGNVLQFLKLISENPSPGVISLLCPPQTLLAFSEIIFPLVTGFIHKSSSATDSSHAKCQKSSSLLHKSVRISLNLVKVRTSGAQKEEEARQETLEQFGIHLIELVSDHPTAILDIKCNAGLVLCHILKTPFLDQCLSYLSNREVGVPSVSGAFESSVLRFLNADYVNRVAICFGAFGTRAKFTEVFLRSVAHAVLLQSESNSTKEAVNLGSARVLEIWMDKVVRYPDLRSLSDVFPLVEIFIFTYLAGHIDAVKNCCRNMLSNLSVVYSRLDEDSKDDEQSNLEDLLVKILAKPYHVKWVSLQSVTRLNPKSEVLVYLWKNIAEMLLCSERTFRNVASDIYLSLMKYTFNSSPDWSDYWLKPLLRTQNSQNIESNWSQKKVILSKAMGRESDREMQKCILSAVLTAMNEGKDLPAESWLLIVECIKIGTELGVEVVGGGSSSEKEGKFRGVLPRDIFNTWTYHESPQIRLASFSLLIETKKTSETFSSEDFETLKLLLRYNLVSQNPAFRQNFMAYFKKLMRRLKDGRSTCARTKKSSDLENYDKFIQWLWLFFTREGLFTGANFSRRCQSLDCLVELLQHFPVTSFTECMEPNEGLEFLRWLGDTYENNKIAAVQVMSQLNIPQFQDPDFIQATLNTAMTLLTSVKPPESVTGRYLLLLLLKASPLYPWNVLRTLLTLLEQISYTLQRKAKTLLEVSSQNPPYGIIQAIRLIFETYKSEMIHEATTHTRNSTRPLKSGSYPLNFDILQEYVTRLLKVCLSLDEFLFPVLGDAAPEGFLPELNENEKITPENSKIVRSVNAQMLLVSSWRSMKEICHVLTELVTNFPLEGELSAESKDKSHMFSYGQVKSIGEHLLYLLMNLMHRGVFEQVFVGFKNFSERLKKSKSRKIQKLSEEWLEDIMRQGADKCVTRRSAGLPFIFQAILTPEVANEEVMTYWMKKLLEPEEGLREIMSVRIHSMNVLRALFRDANFARALMEWVPAGIKMAFKGLRASEWGEQNSGLMLYGSVIRRTFGPKLNLMSAPTFFRRFPEMYDFLLAEIQTTAKMFNSSQVSSTTERENDLAYHLLLLFSCFSTAPGKLEEGNFRLFAFIPSIQACSASKDIQVRTITARALVPFITSPEDCQRVLEASLDQIISLGQAIRNNKLHGDLLQLIAVVNLTQAREEEISSSVAEKFQLIIDIPKNTTCPLIFETVAALSLAMKQFPSLQVAALTLQKVNEEAFLAAKLAYPAAGLSDSKEGISKSKIVFDFDNDSVIRDWIQKGDFFLVDQLLEVLLTGRTLSPGNNAALVQRYLREEFRYPGQTDFEIKFLEYFSKPKLVLTGNSSEEKLQLWEKALGLCEGEFGRVESRAWALRICGKLWRETHEIGMAAQFEDRFCNLLLEWTEIKYDDDLRLAAASALPSLPIGSSTLSPDNFCKTWTAALTLIQDDEDHIRSEVYRKLEKQSSACSLKSIEYFLSSFLTEISQHYSSQGLWTLLAVLLKDDYEVVATVADDVDEDRLFERSEMNMFSEKVTLAKTLLEILTQNPDLLSRLKTVMSSKADQSQFELFQDLSNNAGAVTLGEEDTLAQVFSSILRRSSSGGEVLSTPEKKKKEVEEFLRGHEKDAVQSYIRQTIFDLFC